MWPNALLVLGFTVGHATHHVQAPTINTTLHALLHVHHQLTSMELNALAHVQLELTYTEVNALIHAHQPLSFFKVLALAHALLDINSATTPAYLSKMVVAVVGIIPHRKVVQIFFNKVLSFTFHAQYLRL